MRSLALFMLIIICSQYVNAQETLSIRGTVTDEKMSGLQGATVFIDGSQKAVATNTEGQFLFEGLTAGTYQIAVNMMGYAPGKQSIILTNNSLTIDFVLSERAVILKQVNIGGDARQKTFMKMFMAEFIGTSANAKACKLLNPEVVDFSTEKKLIKATSDQFLMVENPNLGYHIKYLLRDFKYDQSEKTTLFDGECVFEEMKGSPQQHLYWAKNRRETYTGSLMHYLRSMYAKTSRQEGFLTYIVVNMSSQVFTNPNPANPEQMVEYADQGLFRMTYPSALYVLYDQEKSRGYINLPKEGFTAVTNFKTGSIFRSNGLLDFNGKYHDYKNAIIQGFWGRRRLADQVPFEYQPDK